MTELMTIGGGCFWCIEAIFKEINGVTSVVSGYSGGQIDYPTYEQASSGLTGHSEVIQVTFNADIITFRELLEIFFAVHDPTTPNRQGYDIGPQYRSIILYHDQTQKKTAEDVVSNFAQKKWENKVVTELKPFDKFWPAEGYHQDFFAKNPAQAYCQVIINPKLSKFRKEFAEKLKH